LVPKVPKILQNLFQGGHEPAQFRFRIESEQREQNVKPTLEICGWCTRH
jgi:hypothetical protein